jgi:hypothetical protein
MPTASATSEKALTETSMKRKQRQSKRSATPKKRVVSNAEYFHYLRRKSWLVISALILLVPGALGTIALSLWLLIRVFQSQSMGRTLGPGVMVFIGFVGVMWFAVRHLMIKTAIANMKEWRRMEAVVPPTRQHIEQLTAEETLVRASQEPTEGQEKVLLRAVQSTETVKPEELLRASK